MRAEHVVELRLKTGKRLLLRAIELCRMIFEPLACFAERETGQTPVVATALAERFATAARRCSDSADGTCRGFAHRCGVPRHLFLQLCHEAVRMFVQSASSAILRRGEGALYGFAPARLRRFQLAGELAVPGRLRRCQGGRSPVAEFRWLRRSVLRVGRQPLLHAALRLLQALLVAPPARAASCASEFFGLRFQSRGGFLRLLAGDSQGFGFGLQMLRMLVALRNALVCEATVRLRVSCSSCGASHLGNSVRRASAAAAWAVRECSICLVLKLFNRLRRFVGDFGASRGKLLLPLFE